MDPNTTRFIAILVSFTMCYSITRLTACDMENNEKWQVKYQLEQQQLRLKGEQK